MLKSSLSEKRPTLDGLLQGRGSVCDSSESQMVPQATENK